MSSHPTVHGGKFMFLAGHEQIAPTFTTESQRAAFPIDFITSTAIAKLYAANAPCFQ